MLRPKISQADYDFSDIDPAELEACCFYEYARESRAIAHEVENVRRQTKSGESGTIKFGPRVNNIQGIAILSLSIANEFPLKSWRDVPAADRKKILRMIASIPDVRLHFLTVHDPPLSFASNQSLEMTLGEWIGRFKRTEETVRFGFFRANLKYGDDLLINEFRKHLRTFRGKPAIDPFPEKCPSPKKPSGRNGIRDALNALGVMRLRCHCNTFSEAKQKMGQIKNGVFYGHRRSANRACKLALKHFQKYLGWIDSEKPIHFTTGWGRNN